MTIPVMIHNIAELAEEYGTTVDRLKRDIYKYTACGAYIDWNEKQVCLGSIVEGTDTEIEASPLEFPFEMDEFWNTLKWVEANADHAWHERNDEEEE